MHVLVQKFGGTSVATAEQRGQVVEKVAAARAKGYVIVVVVSAMGRQGAPYATDTLLGLAKEVLPHPPAREVDLLLSCGEIIAGALLVFTLIARGLPAALLTGAQAGIITDDRHGEARILRVEVERLRDLLERGVIAVVTGFQGTSASGEVTTLGRGGSDTTAAALGVALEAEAVEIYTDVDGVKTADPRIVEEAQTLERLTYNELCQLAQEGARVVHPRAVEIAMQGNLPLWVKCTFNNAPGTLVCGARSRGEALLADRPVTGIAQVSGLAQLKVAVEEGLPHALIFSSLARAGISVDFISVTPETATFTVWEEKAPLALQVLEALGASVHLRPGCAKVAAVGAGMTGLPGVMAAITSCLEEEGIPILQSADSYTSIWCLVDRQYMEKSVRALHRQFCLN